MGAYGQRLYGTTLGLPQAPLYGVKLEWRGVWNLLPLSFASLPSAVIDPPMAPSASSADAHLAALPIELLVHPRPLIERHASRRQERLTNQENICTADSF